MNREILNLLLEENESNLKLQTVNFTAVSEGNLSHVWIATSENGKRIFVKEYPDWVLGEDVRWIHEYMSKLSERGIPLARSLGPILEREGKFWAAYEFVDGEVFEPNNNLNITNMGGMMARMHTIGRDLSVNGNRNWFSVSEKDYGSLWIGKFKEMVTGQTFLIDGFNFAQQVVSKTTKKPIPVHGDFRAENIRFNRSGNIDKIFDFGNARYDFIEADLAVTLKDLSLTSVGGFDADRQSLFLDAYSKSLSDSMLDPELLFACEIVLCAHESAYLFSIPNRSDLINTKLKAEVEYLRFLCKDISKRIQFYNFQK